MSTLHLDSEVRRHQIVQMARQIVGTRGMASFTIQELAKEVGVSEGAIYRHFKSKDEILIALIHDIERSLLDAISDSARPHDGALAKLRHLELRHFSASERRKGVAFVIIAEALRFADAPVKQATRQMVERYLESIEAILKNGIRKDEINNTVDARAAALMYFGMIQASVTLWSFNNRAHPLAQHSTALWTIFKNGLTSQSQDDTG